MYPSEESPAVAEGDAPAQGENWTDVAKEWCDALSNSEEGEKDFIKRGRKITRHYRADTGKGNTRPPSRYAIFWSNVQTLAPATYSRRPRVEVSRRFLDQDPVGRLAGLILERALQYEVDINLNFHMTLKNVVLDRLLPGRGIAWVRYEPSFKTEVEQVPVEGALELEEKEVEVVKDETTPVDYVFWENFLTSPAQTWADVTWVARRVPFTKAALKERFGKTIARFGGKIEDVPCNYDPITPARDEESNDTKQEASKPELKRALVWEIWDKTRKQVIFICKGCEYPLDIVDDPANLEGFFPCPKPLYATTTNDEQTPVPDFVIYQDQIRELDTITARITLLTQALRVVGVYDASQDSLKNLLQNGVENRMVPVNAWAAFAEKGGLKGVTDFLPLEMVVTVLQGLYVARDQTKQVIYEITGMADIIRGASAASETLGAQQIKAKFANLRLSSRRQEVAEFATLTLQLKAQLMCNLYTPETLVRISSANQLLEVQQHPERLQEALALLKDDKARGYRIEVQEGSMVELDEVDEQQRRDKFMSTVSNFFLAVKNIAAVSPAMMPVALEMLKFTVRGFATGRTLESAIDDAAAKITAEMAKPPQPPQPDPNIVVKLKADENIEMIRQRGETERAAAAAVQESKLAVFEARLEEQKLASEERIAAMEARADQEVEKLKGQITLAKEQMISQKDVFLQMLQAIQASVDANQGLENDLVRQRESHGQALQQAQAKTAEESAKKPDITPFIDGQQQLLEQIKNLAESLAKPKRKRFEYDDADRVVGVKED